MQQYFFLFLKKNIFCDPSLETSQQDGSNDGSQNKFYMEKQGGAVVKWLIRAAWLWCRKSPQGCEFKAGLCHAMTGKLSLSTQQ